MYFVDQNWAVMCVEEDDIPSFLPLGVCSAKAAPPRFPDPCNRCDDAANNCMCKWAWASPSHTSTASLPADSGLDIRLHTPPTHSWVASQHQS